MAKRILVTYKFRGKRGKAVHLYKVYRTAAAARKAVQAIAKKSRKFLGVASVKRAKY